MTTETVHAVAVGKSVRLGKHKPVKDKKTLKLSKYLLDPKTGKKAKTLPRLPTTVVRSNKVAPNAWGEMGNDIYGDCTCAAIGHAEQLTSAIVSDGEFVYTPSDADILKAYWATGTPSKPKADDNGRAMLDVLNYARHVGIGTQKILGYASIDLQSPQGGIRYAIDLFGFCYIGVALPKSAQSQKVWTVTQGPAAKPGTWGGHAIVLVDYDASGPTCVTWGSLVKMTWGFWKKYCDEAYVVLLPSWLNAQGESPVSLNLDQLKADIAAIGTPV